MHTRTKREPDGSTTEWTSPDGISWTMVKQTWPNEPKDDIEAEEQMESEYFKSR